jgi:predicted CopG family antitoxin
MTTTIQITGHVRDKLNEMKLHQRESYNDVIMRLFEDLAELNEETLKDIQEAQKEIGTGKTKTHDEVKKEMGL